MVSDGAAIGAAGLIFWGLSNLGSSIEKASKTTAEKLPQALKQQFAGIQFMSAAEIGARCCSLPPTAPLKAPPPPVRGAAYNLCECPQRCLYPARS